MADSGWYVFRNPSIHAAETRHKKKEIDLSDTGYFELSIFDLTACCQCSFVIQVLAPNRPLDQRNVHQGRHRGKISSPLLSTPYPPRASTLLLKLSPVITSRRA